MAPRYQDTGTLTLPWSEPALARWVKKADAVSLEVLREEYLLSWEGQLLKAGGSVPKSLRKGLRVSARGVEFPADFLLSRRDSIHRGVCRELLAFGALPGLESVGRGALHLLADALSPSGGGDFPVLPGAEVVAEALLKAPLEDPAAGWPIDPTSTAPGWIAESDWVKGLAGVRCWLFYGKRSEGAAHDSPRGSPEARRACLVWQLLLKLDGADRGEQLEAGLRKYFKRSACTDSAEQAIERWEVARGQVELLALLVGITLRADDAKAQASVALIEGIWGGVTGAVRTLTMDDVDSEAAGDGVEVTDRPVKEWAPLHREWASAMLSEAWGKKIANTGREGGGVKLNAICQNRSDFRKFMASSEPVWIWVERVLRRAGPGLFSQQLVRIVEINPDEVKR